MLAGRTTPAGSLGNNSLWEVVVMEVDFDAGGAAHLEPETIVAAPDTLGEGCAGRLCVGLQSTTCLLLPTGLWCWGGTVLGADPLVFIVL